MNRSDDLIQSLCADLKPVKPIGSLDEKALLWLLGSALFVMLAAAYFGPVRDAALQQLISVPRFFIEIALGVVAIAMLALCAFRAAIPGRLQRGLITATTALLALWFGHYIVSLFYPVMPLSTSGERHSCWLQTMAFAIPPILVALVIMRRFYSLQPLRMAWMVSLAAGLLPALYMQIACMYGASHTLHYHILPALVVALVAGGLTGWLIRFTLPAVSASAHSPR